MRFALRTASIGVAAGLIVTATPAATTVAGVTAGHSDRLHLTAPATTLHPAQSSNWFGYNKGFLGTGKRFTSVAGTWVVPTATRHSGGSTTEASSTWVGIGGGCVDTGCASGLTDATLIQAGTEQDVASNGTGTYYAWWEIIPEPESRLSLPVHPGDTMHVTIQPGSKPGLWRIELDNRTTGRSVVKNTAYASTGGSVEWIEETPLFLGTDAGFSALPNLTKTPFTNLTANGASAQLSTAEQIDLIDANGNVIGTPSAPNATRNGFDACAWATTCT